MCPPTASRIMGILGLWWQHKPQASTGFTVVVWTMEVFLGGLIQKMNHNCISEILLLLKVRVILPLGSEFGARACVSSGLLHTSLPALLHNDMFLCPLQPCRRQTCCGGISTSAPLHSEPAALFSHLSYLSIAHSSIKVTLQTAVGHQVHIYMPKQLSMQILIAMSHYSRSWVLVSETPSILDYCWDSSWMYCCYPEFGVILWMGSASGVPDPRELQAPTHLHVSALLTDMTIVSLAQPWCLPLCLLPLGRVTTPELISPL